MRKFAGMLCFVAAAAAAQPVSFEAATIKPSKADSDSSSWHTRPGYLVMKNQSFRKLVAIAYSVREDRVTGGPKWVDSERFDIEARAAGPAKDPELLAMLQTLLQERCRFASHCGSKTVSGYGLMTLKGSLKIPPDESEGGSRSDGSRGKFVAQRVTMARFAESLSRVLGMPVFDMTDAKGAYTFTLEWTPEAAAGEPGAGPSLFEVLPEKLGLKLENRKVAVETIVIDSAERPTEN